MKIKLCVFLTSVIALMCSGNVYSDPATYSADWQYNNNISIEKIYIHWDTGATRVLLSNGEVCHIAKADKELYSAALAMRSLQASGDAICQVANAGNFNGSTDRRMHRLAY